MTASDRALELVTVAARAASEKLATDVVAIDVSDHLVITDIFLLASAPNDRQVRAIVDAVEESLQRRGVKPVRREGEREGRWVLLDFGELVVHVQHAEERTYYALERLWRDCPEIPLPELEGATRERRAAGSLAARADVVQPRQPVAGAARRAAGRRRALGRPSPPSRRSWRWNADRVVSSDLSRARDDGGRRWGCRSSWTPGCARCSRGSGRACCDRRSSRAGPTEFAAWRRGDDVRPGGGESRSETASRTAAAVRRFAGEMAGGTLVVVGHGASLRGAMTLLLGLPASAWTTFEVLGNARWAELRRRADRWTAPGLQHPGRADLEAAPAGQGRLAEPQNNRGGGAVAQLVAHLHGMEGVRGSSPLSSTDNTSPDARQARCCLLHDPGCFIQRPGRAVALRSGRWGRVPATSR